MPLALILVLLDVTLVFHAVKTGRMRPWAFIILLVPGVGAAAYILIELIPELLGGPEARARGAALPTGSIRRSSIRLLTGQLQIADTVANRVALAAECLALARFEEARRHYDHVLQLQAGDEPAYALGKAKAEFGMNLSSETIATLETMRNRWPEFESAEGHLLYARALAAAGRSDEALDEFEAVSQYFPGAEARVRHAMLLDQLGRANDGKLLFAELMIEMQRAPRHVRKMQAEWLAVAEKYLAT